MCRIRKKKAKAVVTEHQQKLRVAGRLCACSVSVCVRGERERKLITHGFQNGKHFVQADAVRNSGGPVGAAAHVQFIVMIPGDWSSVVLGGGGRPWLEGALSEEGKQEQQKLLRIRTHTWPHRLQTYVADDDDATRAHGLFAPYFLTYRSFPVQRPATSPWRTSTRPFRR